MALDVSIPLRSSLVEKLFTFADPDLDLHNSPRVKVKPERHQSKTFFGRLAGQLSKLIEMDQEFANASRGVVPDVGLAVFRDIAADQPQFTPSVHERTLRQVRRFLHAYS